jgi:hypothetical protein
MSSGGYTPIGSASDVQMVNPGQYNNAMNGLSNSMSQYGSQMGGYNQQAGGALAQMGALSGNYDNLIKQMLGGYGQQGLTGKLGQLSESYDPNAGMNLYLSQQPKLQGVAESMAKNSLSEYGQSAQELANATSQASLSDTMSQLASAGLLGAGAGTTAATQAALTPQLQAATQLAQLRSGFLQNVGGQLQSQGLSQAQGAYDQQQQMAMQGILGQMQGVGQAGSLLGNQISGLGSMAQGYGGLGSTYGNLLGQAQSAYSQLSQPEYWQPQYAKNPGFFDYASMLAPIAGAFLGGPAGAAIVEGLGLGSSLNSARSTASYTMSSPSRNAASSYSGYFNNPYFGN